LNQLRALEDAVVIYRLSRAPERRIFYVDVGSLPKIKAEQHMAEMMKKHRNKLLYDLNTGTIRDDRKFMTMLEDYWIARREGGKSTEVVTLPAGQQLGEMGDIDYFKRKLYESLNVPLSRLDPEAIYNVGRSTQISRDEVNFAKFISRLQIKFADLFLQILEKQLTLKKVMAPDEWDLYVTDIKFRFLQDNYFSELKEAEVQMDRLARLEQAVLYAGKYFSHEWVRKNILKQTDEDMQLEDRLIKSEENIPQYQQLGPMDDQFGMMGPGGGPPEEVMPFPKNDLPYQNNKPNGKNQGGDMPGSKKKVLPSQKKEPVKDSTDVDTELKKAATKYLRS